MNGTLKLWNDSHLNFLYPNYMASTENIIEQTQKFVETELEGDGSGHDWWHIHRVRNLACHLAEVEGADPAVTELAALLHDIADWKFHNGDDSVGPKKAGEWLKSLGADAGTIAHVCEIISTVSYKGAGVATPMRTLEGKVVQDADRLDAIGAVGIAPHVCLRGQQGPPDLPPGTGPGDAPEFCGVQEKRRPHDQPLLRKAAAAQGSYEHRRR